MPFSDEDIGAVMAQYQGVDQGALVERAEAIKARLDPAKAEEVGDRKILAKAAKDIMAAMRKQATDRAAEAEMKANAASLAVAETAVAVPGDYVPDHAMQVREYVSRFAVISPETDFYYNKQTRRQTLNKRGLDKVAVAMRINTEIKQVIPQEDRIIVVVRGWIGDREHPDVETEDAADYEYNDKHNDFVFARMEKKEIYSSELAMGDDGKLWFKPDIKDAEIRNIQLRKAVLKEKDFAFRVTVSKARERVIRTLSGSCDLNDQEARMLKEEWEKVAGVTA